MMTLAHAEHMLFLATYGMGYPYTYADRVYWQNKVDELKKNAGTIQLCQHVSEKGE